MCGDLSGYDPDTVYPLDEDADASGGLKPVQPPINPPSVPALFLFFLLLFGVCVSGSYSPLRGCSRHMLDSVVLWCQRVVPLGETA